MKKIFLLTLLSVFLLSVFSQTLPSNPEVIAKINITKYADPDDEILQSSNQGQGLGPGHGWWIFFWKEVKTFPMPNGGVLLICSGFGWKLCIVKFSEFEVLTNWCATRGIDSEFVEKTYQGIIEESDEKAANGEYIGSITKKIAFPAIQGSKETYLLFQMNWEYEPTNLRNGKAEITISTTNNLGF